MKKEAEAKLENEKIAKEENQKEEELKNKLAKNVCINSAQEQYSTSWELSCKLWKKEVNNEWVSCTSNIYSWETAEQNKIRCKTSTSNYDVDDN